VRPDRACRGSLCVRQAFERERRRCRARRSGSPRTLCRRSEHCARSSACGRILSSWAAVSPLPEEETRCSLSPARQGQRAALVVHARRRWALGRASALRRGIGHVRHELAQSAELELAKEGLGRRVVLGRCGSFLNTITRACTSPFPLERRDCGH